MVAGLVIGLFSDTGLAVNDQPNPYGSQAQATVENQRQADNDMTKRVEALVDMTRTPTWQEKQAEIKQRIAKGLGMEDLFDVPEADTSLEPLLDQGLVVFISESVPLSVLRSYARALDKTQGVMVLRGMKGGLGKVGPTMKLVADIIKRDPGCEGALCATYDVPVLIDPILFAIHDIDRVPAVVIMDSSDLKQHCDQAGSANLVSRGASFGDVSLLTHLSMLRADYGATTVDPFIRTLEGRDVLD